MVCLGNMWMDNLHKGDNDDDDDDAPAAADNNNNNNNNKRSAMVLYILQTALNRTLQDNV